MPAMADRFQAALERSAVLRYVLAPLCVGVAVGLHLSMIGGVPPWSDAAPLIHPTGLFQILIVAAAWYGGAGPGFVAALLATLILPRLIAMNYPLIAGFFDLPRFVAFAITGLAVGWGTTSRRRAEAALRRSERELRKARDELEVKVLEQTAELGRSEALLAEAQKLSRTGSFLWKVSKNEIVLSEETSRIFGYGRTATPILAPGLQQSPMARALQRIHPDDAARVIETLERASTQGKDFDYECRLLLPGGAVASVHVVARALRDESGGLEYIGALMDITGRKRAEEALRKAQAELAHAARVMTMGELAASIAHEISQPLGAIAANGEACRYWLAGPTPNLDGARDTVSAIVDDANRAGDIIKRIRALVQKAETQKVRLDINDAIREVVALAEGEARRHGVTLRTELADDLPHVVGDRVQLQQVALNLMMNGVEAMASVADRPRHLLVRSCRHDADQVAVAVQDAGVGIDLEHLERIFDTFYTTKPQGMGMGLAISRSIVENHGGTLRAVPNDGPGMTFQFALPVEAVVES